jgi:O-antigen/teichoic acid export membrane protein
VAFLKRGLLGAIEASIISNSLNLLPLLYFIKDVSLKHIRKTNSKELLSYGLPNVPHYLMALAFSYYTSFSLNKLLSTQELGLYSMAQKFALPFSLLMNSIQASWNAYKFEILKNEDNAREIFKKFSRYLLAVYLLAHVITIIAGKYLLYIATTDIYYKAAEYIPFLSFIVFANAIYYVYGTGVAFGKNQNFAPLISMMGLIIIISTNYYFTIHYGTKGAAISNALAWIGMTVIVFVISEKLYKIGNSKKLMIEIFLFSLIAVITHDYLHSHYPLMNILGSLVLLSFTFVFIRYRIITGEEIKSGLSIIYSKLNLK